MNRKKVFSTAPLLVTVVTVCSYQSARGQEAPAQPTIGKTKVEPAVPRVANVADAVNLSAAQFEVWSRAETKRIYVAKEKSTVAPENLLKSLQLLENAVIQRLKTDRFTRDTSVLDAVSAWAHHERPAGIVAGQSFPQTRRFMDRLLPLLKEHPTTEAMLRIRKSLILQSEDDLPQAVAEAQKALDLLNPLRAATDLERVRTLVDLGSYQFRLGDKAKADANLSEALSYPYHLVRDQDAGREHRELYWRAGTMLIETRRHDLKALKDVFIWPAYRPKLYPLLNSYIAEAEREAVGDTRPVPAAPIPAVPLWAMPRRAMPAPAK